MKNLKTLRSVLAYLFTIFLGLSSLNSSAQVCSPPCDDITVDNQTCCNLYVKWKYICGGSASDLSLPCEPPACNPGQCPVPSSYPVIVTPPCVNTDCGSKCPYAIEVYGVQLDLNANQTLPVNDPSGCCPSGTIEMEYDHGSKTLTFKCL